MRSSLTRKVFKAIIANEPYCITTVSSRLPKLRRDPLSPITQTPSQCLSLFSLASKPSTSTVGESKSTPPEVGKATDVLVRLVRAQRDQTQLPPVQKIAQAFHIVLSYHNQAPARISRSEVSLLTEGFKYVQDYEAKDAEPAGALFSDTDLQQGLSALASSSGKDKFRSDSKKLAYMLFSELRRRRTSQGKAVEAPNQSEPSVAENYIAVLSSTGGAREAYDMLRNSSDGDIQKHWLEVIKGLSSEGLEQDVWKALDEMKARTGNLSVEGHEILTIHFAKNASISATKNIYGQSIAGDGSPTVASRLGMAEFCIRNKDLGWGAPILTHLRSIPEDPRVWDVTLVCSAAQGAIPDDIAAMIDSLAQVAAQSGISGPSMSNVNSLIEYAYSVSDVQAVQSYISMAVERGLQPDAKTFLLQLDYEVRARDLNRAASTFEIISSQDPITDESDAPVLNRFLTAVCFSSNPEYDLVMRAFDSILERNFYFDAETISGLCKVFLQREELEEILGLLRHRVDSYPRNDRARISQSFKEFMIDQSVADQRAFNAYELFRVAFPETSVDDRLQIMHSFFKRKRPDLACLVFGHMRQREDPSARPTPDAYGQCFEGLASCQDVEGLQIVYNMLKLDLEVEPTTRVRNGLMAAYNACGQPFTAIIDHFWKILASREGPTMSSFALALRACETWIPQGAMEARKTIAMMQSWDLEITKEIYDCYIGAIAGQCEFENTIELIEDMENDIGVPADAFT